MHNNTLQPILGHTDIYLIDQILKGRYKPGDLILDAGCGYGRNMHWFLQNGFAITGIDTDVAAIGALKEKYPAAQANFGIVPVEQTGFPDNHFDHVICNAVLHFAVSTTHFNSMFAELVRTVKPGGTLFIRMASDIGIEEHVKLVAEGVYNIPDGTSRFLLNRQLLADSMQLNNLLFSEPLKTVNVADSRCMSTLLLQKNLC